MFYIPKHYLDGLLNGQKCIKYDNVAALTKISLTSRQTEVIVTR